MKGIKVNADAVTNTAVIFTWQRRFVIWNKSPIKLPVYLWSS